MLRGDSGWALLIVLREMLATLERPGTWLELSVPPPAHKEGKGGWSFITKGQCFNQFCLHKGTSTEIETRLGALQGWWTHWCAGRLACSEGTQKPCAPNSNLALYISSIWLFLSYSLYNETVFINIMFYQLYESYVLANYQTWGRVVVGNLYSTRQKCR